MTGCATIFTGTKGKIRINSDPSGAEVYMGENYMGTTPCDVSLPRGMDWNNDMLLGRELTLKLEGYETKMFVPDSEFNSIAILNLFQIYFWAVDFFTGALWVYNPRDYTIKLVKH
jgi:hypothetical protein